MANRKFWDSNRNPITWHKIDSAFERAYIKNKEQEDDFDSRRNRIVKQPKYLKWS